MDLAEKVDRRLAKRKPSSYAPTENESCADWMQRCFYIPELDGPIQLFPYQVRALDEAHRQDENGKYIYNLIVWGDIKKSAKSTITAAVALYRGLRQEWGSIKIIANDLKQADSRVAYYLRRAIQLNPAMTDIIQRNYKTTLPNRTFIEAIPIDPSGEAGGNDDLIIFSELWAAKHKAIQQMWTEMTLSPTKFGYSQRWIETYAGYQGESPVLEPIYKRLVKDENRIDDEIELYADGTTLCLWGTMPRLPWQTPEYYKSEEEVLIPSEFNRVHRNQWEGSTEKFVNIIWWDNCREDIPALRRDEPIVIALDANKGSTTVGYVADTFSMVAVSRHPHRPEDVAVRYCGIWQPQPGQLMDYQPIEQELRRLCESYSVIEVCYDPTQLHKMAMDMQREGLALFKEFNQQKDRLKADKQLQTIIMARQIAHDGNPLLRQHIDNANAKKYSDGSSNESSIRIVKRSDSMKIDAAVALSMGTARILHYNIV